MKFSSSCISLVLLAASSANAFAPSSSSLSLSKSSTSTSTSKLNIVVGDTAEEFAARVEATFEKAPKKNMKFDDIVQSSFPGAISNQDLVQDAVSILSKKGYDGENTLLATSLCCDELARQLEDDFNGIYGNNFNLGGLGTLLLLVK
jgi:ABC-type sugar transport system substrate-binding protein